MLISLRWFPTFSHELPLPQPGSWRPLALLTVGMAVGIYHLESQTFPMSWMDCFMKRGSKEGIIEAIWRTKQSLELGTSPVFSSDLTVFHERNPWKRDGEGGCKVGRLWNCLEYPTPSGCDRMSKDPPDVVNSSQPRSKINCLDVATGWVANEGKTECLPLVPLLRLHLWSGLLPSWCRHVDSQRSLSYLWVFQQEYSLIGFTIQKITAFKWQVLSDKYMKWINKEINL